MGTALIDKFSREELEQIVKESSSIREIMRRIGYVGTSGSITKSVKKRLIDFNIPYNELFSKSSLKNSRRKLTDDDVFTKDSTVSQSTVVKRYLEGNYSEYKCAICGQEPFWNGQTLTLTLDHINGINNDNRIQNLRWICPNCNRQLPTYGGRNFHRNPDGSAKKNHCAMCKSEISKNATLCKKCSEIQKREKQEKERQAKNTSVLPTPSSEELREELIKTPNFTAVGKKYGVSGNTIIKWCKKYNIPHVIAEYKPPKKEKQQRTNSKPVNMLDINTGEFIRRFDSLMQARNFVNGSDARHIASVCKGYRKTAYGYKWEFANT